MFDAKSLLEQIVQGSAPAAQRAGQGGGLGDILGQIANAVQPGGAASPSAGGFDLDGLLRQVLPANPAASAAPHSGAGAAGTSGLDDLLGGLQKQLGGAGAAGGAGGLMDVLGQVLGQATQGVKDGAGRVDQATGVTDALAKATGVQSADELIAKLKDLVANNQFAAGTAAGGLGGLLLGTKTGRSVIGSAAKLGALALIGGLAYKAAQNYQQGKPLLTGASGLVEAAPDGSGFEPAAQSNDSAALLIRTMIAAAAADGRIDEAEKTKILGAFEQSGGLTAEARAFIERELADPADARALAAAVTSRAEAMQVYTAARLAIVPDSAAEAGFLNDLAAALGLEPALAKHIDATMV